MKTTALATAIALATVLGSAGANAEPVKLTDAQMDNTTAAGFFLELSTIGLRSLIIRKEERSFYLYLQAPRTTLEISKGDPI